MRVRDGLILLVFSLLISIGHRAGLLGLKQIDPQYIQTSQILEYLGLSICLVGVSLNQLENYHRMFIKRIVSLMASHSKGTQTLDVARIDPQSKDASCDDESIIRESGMVDGKWYIREYSDVANSKLDPALHYFTFGAAEGRNPNPYFDTKWYLDENPDVADAGVNPLLHYILVGSKEERAAGPRFDTAFYLEQNEDVRLEGILPLLHYMKYGLVEGRNGYLKEL